jgi:hypothetical protein
MLARLPNICLYLEEPSKERFYVHHMGNGQFHINGGSMIWPWTDVLNHYKQDPAFCPREDCLMDILFVATGTYKDRPITSFDSLCSDDSWLLVGTPYEPYKSLAKLPTGTRLFMHREWTADSLSVVHRGGGLFEVPGQGLTLYNRHQLLAFYDRTKCCEKTPVDPLATLYIEQGCRKGNRLDQLFAASLTDEEWARIGLPEAEAEAEAEAVPATPVRVPSTAEPPSPPRKMRLFKEPEPRIPPPHKNPFRKALHLPSKLRVTYQGRPALVTHERPLYKDKALVHLQFLDGSKETVTFFGTTDEEDDDYEAFRLIRLNSSVPISLLCLLSYSPERIAEETTDRWPQEEESVASLLERLNQKETALQAELKDLDRVADLYERVAALEIRVHEAQCYAPLDDEASLLQREQEAEAQLGRLEGLTKRSKDLDIRIGQARMIWCSEELADGEEGLAKREEEAAKELAELAVLEQRVAALRALEKRVAEARKVLATV